MGKNSPMHNACAFGIFALSFYYLQIKPLRLQATIRRQKSYKYRGQGTRCEQGMKIDRASFFFFGMMKIDQQASVAFWAADAPCLDTILTVRNVLRNGCQPHQRHFNRPRWQNRYISPLLTTLAYCYCLLPLAYCLPAIAIHG